MPVDKHKLSSNAVYYLQWREAGTEYGLWTNTAPVYDDICSAMDDLQRNKRDFPGLKHRCVQQIVALYEIADGEEHD